MPKPLCIPLPATPAYDTWTRVHDWGARWLTSGYHDTLELETTESVFVLAACDGFLSVVPTGLQRLSEVLPPTVFAPIFMPSTVSLYLSMLPGTVLRTGSSIEGFLYRNLEMSSLITALGPYLDMTVIGDEPPPTREQTLFALLSGVMSLPVLAGLPIGRPGLVDAGPVRRFGFAAYNVWGTKEPLAVYDELRDYVRDGQDHVDLLLAALPRPDDLFESGLSKSDAIARTGTRLYPWSALNTLPDRYLFDRWSTDWRTIRDHQKAIYLERLRVRVGHGGTSTEPPFEFNDSDHRNLFQLEAVTEFYANFVDPWKPGAAPIPPSTPVLSGNEARSAAGRWVHLDGSPSLGTLSPNRDKIYLPASRHPSRTYRIIEVDAAGHRVRVEGDPQLPAPPATSTWRIAPYQVVDLIDPGGASAVPVPGMPAVLVERGDLTRVWPNASPVDPDQIFDTMYLEEDRARPNKLYKIIAVDPETRTVTLDAVPDLASPSHWHINQRPWLIAIDPIGGRLSGGDASTDAAIPGRVVLPSADLSRINLHFDTLYLPSDTARPSRTYRIEEVNLTGHWVRVAYDGANPPPAIDGDGSWSIQAGVGGSLVAQSYDLRSGRGYDHYDAVLFLVHGGQIRHASPWTTYTSHGYSDYNANRSSVRGNKDYEYFSYLSGKKFINYGLKVVDFGAGARPGVRELFDGVREARWYYESVTRDDSAAANVATVQKTGPGKSEIRFHYGNDGHGSYGAALSWSAGCIVSPAFDDMRAVMAQRYSAESMEYQGSVSPVMAQIASLDHLGAGRLYTSAAGPSSAQWNNKLVGYVWIIRPSERSL